MNNFDDITDNIIDIANKLMRFMDENSIDTRDGSLACGVLYSIAAKDNPKNHEIVLHELLKAAKKGNDGDYVVRIK